MSSKRRHDNDDDKEKAALLTKQARAQSHRNPVVRRTPAPGKAWTPSPFMPREATEAEMQAYRRTPIPLSQMLSSGHTPQPAKPLKRPVARAVARPVTRPASSVKAKPRAPWPSTPVRSNTLKPSDITKQLGTVYQPQQDASKRIDTQPQPFLSLQS